MPEKMNNSANMFALSSIKTTAMPNVLKFTQNFIGEGLHPRAITRDLDWGVKIPLKD